MVWWLPLVASTLLSSGIELYKDKKMSDRLKELEKKAEKLKLTPEERQAMRNEMMGDLQAENALTKQNIKQVASAKRMPSGAITSAFAQADEQMAKGLSDMQNRLTLAGKEGERQYYNAMEDIAGTKMGLDANMAGTMQGYLGNLTKVFMLWQNGYFSNPGAGTTQPPSANLPRFNITSLFGDQMPGNLPVRLGSFNTPGNFRQRIGQFGLGY